MGEYVKNILEIKEIHQYANIEEESLFKNDISIKV